MTFGKFGREDSALVLVTVGGGLSVKILKRTAQFERMETFAGPAEAAKVSGRGGGEALSDESVSTVEFFAKSQKSKFHCGHTSYLNLKLMLLILIVNVYVKVVDSLR